MAGGVWVPSLDCSHHEFQQLFVRLLKLSGDFVELSNAKKWNSKDKRTYGSIRCVCPDEKQDGRERKKVVREGTYRVFFPDLPGAAVANDPKRAADANGVDCKKDQEKRKKRERSGIRNSMKRYSTKSPIGEDSQR